MDAGRAASRRLQLDYQWKQTKELAMVGIQAGEANAKRGGGYYPDQGVVGRGRLRSLIYWQVLSAVLLLAMGGIHLYLVLTGFSGLLGALFVLNAIGALVLAIAMIAAP